MPRSPALRHALLLLLSFTTVASYAAEPAHWIGTWGASPTAFRPFGNAPAPEPLNGQTVREKLRISVGGSALRIRISNEFGNTPLVIGAASVGVSGDDASVASETMHSLTFGGLATVTVPPGAPLLSDPVDLPVADLTELTVSLYLPQETALSTVHGGRTAWISGKGDFTAATRMDDATLGTNMLFLSAVYVNTTTDAAVLVTFGDSITDGTRSTPHTYNDWPDQFALRVAGGKAERRVAVVNQGISGNQVLQDGAGVSALARFDRDVLSTPGLSHVIVLEGINDLGTSAREAADGSVTPVRSAAEIISGYRQMIARAHAQGVKIFGATLTPFQGMTSSYYSPAKDEVRVQINDWIRTSKEFDGVVDFEAAVRDPSNPRTMLKDYNSGDFLHPGDAGYSKMAESIKTALFK